VSLRRRIITAIGIQSIGTVAAFSTLLLIARLEGPAAQGKFAQTKSWVDLLTALGCFGFPQGFVYLINRLGVTRRALLRFSLAYSAAFFLVALPATMLAARRLLGTVFQSSPFEAALLIAAATAGIVLHELWRGVYLTYEDGPGFSVMTILQAVGLLTAVAVALLAFRSDRFETVYLAAGVFCALVTWGLIRTKRHVAESPDATPVIPWGALLNNGSHVFLQNVLIAFQPAATFWVIRTYGGGNREVGWFNLALYVYQAFALPLGMVSPIFFNRWSRDLSRESLRSILPPVLKTAGGVILLSVAALVPLRHAVVSVFGTQYEPAVPICQTLLLAAAPLCLFRVLMPAIHSLGFPQLNTFTMAVRVLAICAAMWALRHVGPTTTLAAAVWTSGEFLSAGLAIVIAMLLSSRAAAGRLAAAAGPDLERDPVDSGKGATCA
jgi:O-antigen/teichoic acid export membrane protein